LTSNQKRRYKTVCAKKNAVTTKNLEYIIIMQKSLTLEKGLTNKKKSYKKNK